MALQILEQNGTFHLQGTLNSNPSRSLIIQFEYMMQKIQNLTINIDKVSRIDASGVEALKTLMAIALRNGNELSIVGNGSKDIYDDYYAPMAA